MHKKIILAALLLPVLVAGVSAEARTFRYSTSGDILGLTLTRTMKARTML